MYMIDLIIKKQEGKSLNAKEFEFLIKGIVNETIPDYQISSWLMAVYFKGMNSDELILFTKSIIESGTTINLSKIDGFSVDKHSTGGIGDKTSLVFGPIAAACDLKVTKISGKGLGNTGGTIDKLKIIPNFKCDLQIENFINIVNKVGMSIISQTNNLVPADEKIYALRDVSGTVNSLSLIAASIMSKKIAMNADLILIDIKCGKGSFIKNLKNAKILAKLMIHIGKNFNKKIFIIISDMNNPLGKTIGNYLELKEVILSLKNKGPKDLKILVSNLVGLALLGAKKVKNLKEGIKKVNNVFKSEKPLQIFYDFIKNQNGDIKYLDNINILPPTKYIIKVKSYLSGYLNFINNQALGKLSVILGSGRIHKDDIIDPIAGIYLKKINNQKVNKNSVIMELHTNKNKNFHKDFLNLANSTFKITKQKQKNKPIILEIIM